MKFNKTMIWVIAGGLLLGAPVWAEEDVSAGHEAEHKPAHDTTGQTGMEQIGGADNATQDNTTNEPILVEQSGFSRGSVVRSVFTSAVEDREPTDSIKELSTNSDKVIYYTELRDMAGQTARHRWEYNGEVMAEVEFNVGGSRWRVWSSKSFVPGWTGEWKVSVLNGANEVISEDLLTYSPSMAEPAVLEPIVEKSTLPAAPVDAMQVQ